MKSPLLVKKFLEMNELRKKLKDRKSKLIACKRFGDLEMVLVKTETGEIGGFGVVYQVGIQRQGRDFTDIDDQFKNQTTGFEEHGAIDTFLENIVTTLNKWVEKYGKLHLASFDPNKTFKYVRILVSLGFNLKKQTTKFNLFPIYYIDEPSKFKDF